MSAIDEIRDAIDKLEALKVASTQGPWVVWPTSYCGEVAAHLNFTSAGTDNMDDLVPPFDLIADANLIVTLHRTIDAQLAILELAMSYGELGKGNGSRFTKAALTLARAINGVTS